MRKTRSLLWLRRPDVWIGLGLFAATLALYLATLAPGIVFGDPAEYVFVPHVWGVIHPPGYAFYTLLCGVFQRIVPFGSAAWRVNLLSAVAGASIAALVYGSVRTLTPRESHVPAYLPGLFAGASAAVATDIWQHSIHANAHIVTALLATLSVFLLLRWQQVRREGWLYAFCAVAGLSMTHHPLLAFSFPAYAAFILAVRPGVWREWRMLLKMVGCALLGMSAWLYFPIRSTLPTPPPFGPGNMNTLDGFLDLVLARGLRVNLFYFGPADQPDRLLVLETLLSLQFSPVTIGLMAVGLVYLVMRDRRSALLFGLFLLVNLAFILNTIQDVMAYLMVPFAALAMLAGVGVAALLEGLHDELQSGWRWGGVALTALLLALPISRAAWLAGRVSLRGQDEAAAWVEAVFARFDGKDEGALLLADWEHLTPLWYAQYVEGRALDETDVRLIYVATTSERPWVDNVWAHIGEGPVYLSGYRREVIEEGFRLRPEGPLYRVVLPPATQLPDVATRLDADAGPVTVVGYGLPQHEVAPGETIPLTLYLTARQTPPDIIFPYTTLGEVRFEYTTDSHLLSPWWKPGEIIAERFDMRAPLNMQAGVYSLQLGLRNLSQGGELRFEGGTPTLSLGEVRVSGASQPLPTGLMADIGHQIGLVRASARVGWRASKAVWNEPLVVRPGDAIRVRLTWRALAPPDDNWKVFVHLIDAANQPVAQQDNPPLGGAFPTYLWFPKWVAGQQVIDPYRLVVPPGTPPGEYALEVGMYSFTGLQRAPFFDAEGNLSGDRFILGPVRVEE
jgi:hypothetical protein